MGIVDVFCASTDSVCIDSVSSNSVSVNTLSVDSSVIGSVSPHCRAS